MNVNINIVTTQFNELGEENVIKSNVDGTLYQKKDIIFHLNISCPFSPRFYEFVFFIFFYFTLKLRS